MEPHEKKSPYIDLWDLRLNNKYSYVFDTPARAAAMFNKGGLWVANHYDDSRVLRRAIALLDLSKEIYKKNNRFIDSASAATFAAEGRLNLAVLGDWIHFGEIKDLLDYAEREFGKVNHAGMLAYIGRLREWYVKLAFDVANKISEKL